MVSKNSPARTPTFSDRLLEWFDIHGRHDLPWQHPRNAYRVWLSEIMLQQTQVKTVIPYFNRFVQRFPSIKSLATAELDEVLHLWTGLGYYARARNLHKAARQMCEQYACEFPHNFDDAITLPGIGRSTAGAILAQAFEQPFAILDGNVKRVLTRFHAIDGWPGQKQIENQLWTIAEDYTPQSRVCDYTQAIMDLGATVCTRSKPGCDQCPLMTNCRAYQLDNPAGYPTSKPKKTLPVKTTCMLLLVDDQQSVLLEQRPPSGIWGSLWSFPECPNDAEPANWCEQHLQLRISDLQELPPLRHTFSHFHLDITPLLAHAKPAGIMESDKHIWYNTASPDARGFPAPVKQLLDEIAH
jgi:A/G-specific adenine glycosylase